MKRLKKYIKRKLRKAMGFNEIEARLNALSSMIDQHAHSKVVDRELPAIQVKKKKITSFTEYDKYINACRALLPDYSSMRPLWNTHEWLAGDGTTGGFFS